jgi:hypothetical protein
LAYAFNNRIKYNTILWLDALNIASVTASIKGLVRKYSNNNDYLLKSNDAEIAKKQFIDWLEKRSGEWLVILDNPDTKDLRRVKNLFADVKKGHIIVIMRQKDVRRLTILQPVLVEGIEKDKATAFNGAYLNSIKLYTQRSP